MPQGGAATLGLKHVLMLVGVALMGLHLGFSRADFDFILRALFAIPGLLLLYELHRFLEEPASRILPFNVLGLLYHYIYFCLPSLFDIEFNDLSGLVIFTEQARFSAAVAISAGSLFLYGGMRAGEWLGRRGQSFMISVSPPDDISDGYRKATLVYGFLCFALMSVQISAPSIVPQSLSLLVFVTLAFDFALGLVLAKPEFFRDSKTRNIDVIFAFLGGGVGLLRGILEPVMRLGVALLIGKWAYIRRVSVTAVVAILGVYLLLQPVKGEYRNQIWYQSRDQATVGERMSAWGSAISGFWSGEDLQKEDTARERAISRVDELDSTMHAFMMLPGRVKFLDGAGWSHVPTSFIPRLVWPDKPTTMDLEQRYAIEFNRQTETGARTAAILLPLTIDGYWNFGWLGVAIACFVMGLWVGMAQRLFAGAHWALNAMGVAHLSRLSSQTALSAVYAGLFQHIVGLVIASWGVYWLARFIGSRDAARARLVPVRGPHRAAPVLMRGGRRTSPR